ncbi:FtsX-like permease family protein [Parafilimonas sp.]|uniref:FtsX-like permease family protein n=1 Tax=Parafilimonas sp. TaxID=1969739 RepID=UPI0039E290D9
MNFLFAWRYFKSKKSTNAINIIAWISMIAIMVSTAALIIVLSVFNGFEDLVKNLYGDFYADIKITPGQGKFFTADTAFIQKVKSVNGVNQLSFTVEEKAVLVNGDYQSIVFLKGVDKNYNTVNKLSHYITDGKYELGTPGTPAIVSGSGIANAVGAIPGLAQLPLVIYLPNRKANNFNSLNAMHSFEVKPAGIFSVQQEFDDKYAFTNLAFIQYMLDLNADEYSSIELSAKNPDETNDIKKRLQKKLGEQYIIKTSYEQNQSLFTVMQIEKWVIYGILSLILVVAAFNMIGALTMLVLEKEKDIAVLKAMGASEKRIQNIFLSEGFVLAGAGGFLGMLIALIICFIQIKFKLIKLEGGTFIINYYPVKMTVPDFILVTLTIMIIAVLASWIPAKKAAAQFYSLKS